ncbi:MAG TPA: hypothetical protein VNU68_09805 [Verrucomicrobiae bacterium]|nr:hypothetical protein [Verrucomicrobiae bacterium]
MGPKIIPTAARLVFVALLILMLAGLAAAPEVIKTIAAIKFLLTR